MGILRSFDQFANVVLQDACDRVIVGEFNCDIPLGQNVIRGENVVLIGELDLDKEELPPDMTRVSEAEIKRPVLYVTIASMRYLGMPNFLVISNVLDIGFSSPRDNAVHWSNVVETIKL
nr:sm-like protein lsm1b [Quercus suber]